MFEKGQWLMYKGAFKEHLVQVIYSTPKCTKAVFFFDNDPRQPLFFTTKRIKTIQLRKLTKCETMKIIADKV